MKSTTQWVGYFETISGHFFGNYINISHKTEVLIVVLMCLTYWNPYLIKNYNIKHNFCHFCFFQFCKKKNWKITTHKWPFFDHFWPFFGQLLYTEVQTVILRCLVYLYLDWIKSYDIILVKHIFFSCLKMHYNRAVLPKWVLPP